MLPKGEERVDRKHFVQRPALGPAIEPQALSESSRMNGRQCRSLCTLARQVISSPVAPRVATLARIDSCGDEGG
jgi:hypothetical protein